MFGNRQSPLKPRNGHTLVVGIVARISGCANQKELSLDDQVDHGKQVIAELYDGPVEYRVIAAKGKGERLDRPEVKDIDRELRTRELDFLVAEDIGRIIRGTEASRLCGVAVDHGVRVLAPNDCIDTAEDTWEEDVISACRDHVGHNAHTSRRLKQKLMNRFKRFGGATPVPIFGYVKPESAKTYDDWFKDPEATPVLLDGLDLLRNTGNCSAVADMFNRREIPVGTYCRRETWNGPMVRRLYRNPLLKGQPGRGFRHTVKHHETGRRVSLKNPKGPVFRDYSHLIHIDPAALDEVNTLLDARNGRYKRKPVNATDPLYQVPRKRTRFPGQHARCWYCGRHFVWGGNGVTENLMCSGAREWRCWNSVGFDGPLSATLIVQTITAELYRLDGFQDQFTDLVEAAAREGSGRSDDAWQRLLRNEETLAREKRNVAQTVREYGARPLLLEQLDDLERREQNLVAERLQLERRMQRTPQIPGSVADLRQLLEMKLRDLAIHSPECGDLLRRLVPEFRVHLVRLCDGGHLLPRARVTIALDGVASDAQHVPGLSDLLTRELTLDLFQPPQRERIRDRAVRMEAQKMKQRDIARELSTDEERVTQAAVQKALALHRVMERLGLTSPYVAVLRPPGGYGKLRRHKNAKYRFEPLPGYRPPDL